jgi:hypothetical protein
VSSSARIRCFLGLDKISNEIGRGCKGKCFPEPKRALLLKNLPVDDKVKSEERGATGAAGKRGGIASWTGNAGGEKS